MLMPRCRATSKQSGERCKRHAAKGLNVCSMHGGKSLRGVDSPRFKTGRHSKYLPDRLAERYEEALNDAELTRLNDEIAVVDARLQDLLDRLRADGEAIASGRDESTAWGLILGLMEQRRKLVATERKHLADDERFIAVESLMVFMAALLDIVRRWVPDPETQKAIGDEVRLLISGADDPH
jgi:hypothetical protein